MFDIFKSCIVIACDNYFRIMVNVPLQQQLCCNYYNLLPFFPLLSIIFATMETIGTYMERKNLLYAFHTMH